MAWPPEEVAQALRASEPVRTPFGLGALLAVRADGSVVVRLPYGDAFLNTASLGPPPQRFAAGARVQVRHFGKAVVVALRRTAERVDYCVQLLDCRLSDGRLATGFVSPRSLAPRAAEQLTFAESVADAAALRQRGNEAFKAKDFDAAVAEYSRSTEVLGQSAVAGLSATQKEQLRDGVVKALSNTAQCLLNKGRPDFSAAHKAASEALLIAQGMVAMEPREAQRLASKLRYRQGVALMGLGEWRPAIEALAHPVHSEGGADDVAARQQRDEAQRKLREAREALRKEEDKSRKVWSSAFAKLGGSDATAASPAAAAAPSYPYAPATAPLTPASPRKAAAVGSASPAASPAASPQRPLTGAASKRKSVSALKEAAAAQDAADASSAGAGSGAGAAAGAATDRGSTGDATAELEMEGEEESTWGSYLLYGGLAAGALVLGALAVSALRGGGRGAKSVASAATAALRR